MEEVAHKAKEAVTPNDHADEPKTEFVNGNAAHSEAIHQSAAGHTAELDSETVPEKVEQAEPVKTQTSVTEAEPSTSELQTPSVESEAVH